MGFTNNAQLRELFLSCGMGFLIGAYYDVFRIVRRVWRAGIWRVFVQDIVFFSTVAPLVFLLALAITGGVLRVYLFVGIVGGFVAYRYTVGRAVVHLVVSILAMLSRWEDRLKRWMGRPIRFVRRKCAECVKNLRKKRKNSKKGVATTKENGV